MKKRLFALAIFAIAICVSVFFGTGITSAFATDNTESISVSYFENSNKSVAVYDNVMSSYKRIVKESNGKEITTYSNNFGGVFIDNDGFLNIGLVGSQESTLNFNGQVKYRQYAFTYNYLKDIQEAVTQIMPDYDIYMVGIDEELNAVSII